LRGTELKDFERIKDLFVFRHNYLMKLLLGLMTCCCQSYNMKTEKKIFSSMQWTCMRALFLKERVIPQSECPQSECPQSECPQSKCPQSECPQSECPQSECPQSECPQSECLQSECQQSECPPIIRAAHSVRPLNHERCTLAMTKMKHAQKITLILIMKIARSVLSIMRAALCANKLKVTKNILLKIYTMCPVDTATASWQLGRRRAGQLRLDLLRYWWDL
jgi:hypothetical protein